MKKISNRKIIKEIIYNDLLKIRMLRYVIVPIIFLTIFYTVLEIKISTLVKNLNQSIANRKGEHTALERFVLQSLLVAVLTELNGFIFTGVVQYIYRNTAKSTFKGFISLSPKNFSTIGGGEIQTIIDRKSKSASELIEVFLTSLLPICLKLLFALIAVIKNMGGLAGFIMFVCVSCYATVTILIAQWRSNIRRELNNSENRSSNKLQDGLNNHETIVSFGTTDLEVDEYDQFLKINASNSNRLWRALYILNLSQRAIFLLQSFFIIYAGISGILSQNMSSNQLIYLMSITSTVTINLSNLGYLYTRYTQAIINARSTYDTMLDIKKENNKFKITEFKESIKFNNLSFGYESRQIFNKINLEIYKGEKVAIIGKNGSGKSTLLKLLLKFDEDYKGSILIDDIDIKKIKDEFYRNLLGYIPQNTFLFNESVKYNIKYGSFGISDEDIFALCKEFGLYDVFMNLENGFDTNVGERGRLLSGGEKQKILLMRTMLRNKEIMALDEPTAALDKESEKKILEIILQQEDRTVLMIIHNLELISKFDKIIYIDENNIEVYKNNIEGQKKFSTNLQYFLSYKLGK